MSKRNDIFITTDLPALIPSGKQVVVEPWIYQCMAMVKEQNFKSMGLSPDVIESRVHSELREAGYVTFSGKPGMSSPKNAQNARKGQEKGPLSTFFK